MKKPEMRSELLEITPYLATKWLELNNDNRNISDRWVDAIASDIAANKWDPNNASVGLHVDAKGEPKKIVDGQHRLWAIVKAQKSIWTWVVFGDERNLRRENIDRVKPRSVADQLHLLDGIENATFTTATLSVISAIEDLTTHTVGHTPLSYERARALLTIHERGFAWYKELIKGISTLSRRIMAKGSVAGALIYAHPTSMAKVENFAIQLRDGENLVKNDPAYALRAYLIRNTGSTRGSRDSRMQRFEIVVVVLRSIMAYLKGENLVSLRGGQLSSGEFYDKARQYFARAQQSRTESVPPMVRKAAGK